MLNKSPIFINGFARGGTNMLTNLLLSHPGVCSATGELQKVFRGGASVEAFRRTIYKQIVYNLPVAVLAGRPLFDPSDLSVRPKLSATAACYIDWILYREKLKASNDRHNKYVREGEVYSVAEIKKSRLLCKNVNGLILLTDAFRTIYPDATFFGLIRNGLALCEGYVRRGRKPEDCAVMYNELALKMRQDSSADTRYFIVRFEDLVAHPLRVAEEVYRNAGLKLDEVEKIRLQSKATLQADGRHILKGHADRGLRWYHKQALDQYFNPNIDALQISKLSKSDRNSFVSIAGDALRAFNYL